MTSVISSYNRFRPQQYARTGPTSPPKIRKSYAAITSRSTLRTKRSTHNLVDKDANPTHARMEHAHGNNNNDNPVMSAISVPTLYLDADTVPSIKASHNGPIVGTTTTPSLFFNHCPAPFLLRPTLFNGTGNGDGHYNDQSNAFQPRFVDQNTSLWAREFGAGNAVNEWPEAATMPSHEWLPPRADGCTDSGSKDAKTEVLTHHLHNDLADDVITAPGSNHSDINSTLAGSNQIDKECLPKAEDLDNDDFLSYETNSIEEPSNSSHGLHQSCSGCFKLEQEVAMLTKRMSTVEKVFMLPKLAEVSVKGGESWLARASSINPSSSMAVALLEVFQTKLEDGMPQLTTAMIEASVKEKMRRINGGAEWNHQRLFGFLKELVREGQLIMETYGLSSLPHVSAMHRHDEFQKNGQAIGLSVRVAQGLPTADLIFAVLTHFRKNLLQPSPESLQKALSCYFGVKATRDEIWHIVLNSGPHSPFVYLDTPGRSGIFPRAEDGSGKVWQYVSMFDFGDLCSQEVWTDFHHFLDDVKIPQNGRYGFAKCCCLLGPKSLRDLPFGILIWMVQKCLMDKTLYLDSKKQIVVRDFARHPKASAVAWEKLRTQLLSLLGNRTKLQQVKFMYRKATGNELMPQQFGFKKLKDLLLEIDPRIKVEDENGATMVSLPR
eukprot:GEMP01001754.1.p1 GENE.GEMP01001754.1~~GEMP01001754.1.p1  ORF type:complete len:663 (+),score=124.13 GEMP01001754.1:354-2342(+)